MNRLVVDTSALVAILLREAEADAFTGLIGEAAEAVASAMTSYELRLVMLGRRGAAGADAAVILLHELGIRIAPFDEPHVEAAFRAYARYGRGIHPKARLNMGDCAAYALARMLDAPLLFKGEDFAATDIAPAHPHP